uniref:hypothetical protein n=1 Tax=Yoonia sp. TaxID=2212373 RepID=UPI004047326E
MPDNPQANLFGDRVLCPDVQNLPLIVSATSNHCEVLAPGSVYQPLLLDQQGSGVVSGPGALNREEEKFVRDLIMHLYPKKDYPKAASTPLVWGKRKIWLKRNIEKDSKSFRLRVDSSDWYYPDFVIWIVDEENRTQTFGFADPKGLALGAHAGWGEYKVVCTQIVPHFLHEEIGPVIIDDQPWTFRIRGVLVSTSSFDGLREQRKFLVRDENDVTHPPTKEQFAQARIVFQEPRADEYIPEVLRLLTDDNDLDEVLMLGAEFFGKSAPVHFTSEIQADLAIRHRKARTISDFTSSIVEDYVLPGADGKFGSRARQKRHDQVNRLITAADPAARCLWELWPAKDQPSRFLLEHFSETI